MSNFVHGQLVELANTFSSAPVIARFVEVAKNGYVLHKCNLNDGPTFALHKYIEEMNQKNLLMVPGRTYKFKKGDQVVYRVRRDHLDDAVDELGVVADVNDQWKYVVLSQPTAGHEGSKVMYFEQILLKREYDHLVG